MHGNYKNRQNYNKNENFRATVTPALEPVCEESAVVESTTPEKTETIAIVTGCVKLNVREKPDANAPVLATIPVKSEVMVDLNGSTTEFYKICNSAGIEGFCMKKYIAIHP